MKGTDGTDPNFCTLCYFLDLNRKTASSELLLLGLKNNSFNFSSTWQTAWGCAGDAWGVPVRVVELRGIKGCNDFPTQTSIPYQPYLSCGLKRIMDAFQNTSNGSVQALKDLKLRQMPRWIFFFDAETLPLPHMDLKHFVQNSNPSLFLFEDFHTGATYPNSFLARVDEYSHSFFTFVDNFYHSLRETTRVKRLHHSALEVALLHWLKDELPDHKRAKLHVNDSIDWVDSRFRAIRNRQTYDRYIATARYILGPRRRFGNLVLLRRGQGFCMDMSEMAGALSDAVSGPEDPQHPQHFHFFCFKTHVAIAPQEIDAACLAKVSICEEWISSCMLKPTMSESTATEKIRSYRPQRMGLGMVNDIGSCWPTCGPDVPTDVWRNLELGLHFNAKCPNGHCRLGCCCNDIDIVSEQHAADSADAFLLSLVVGLSIIISILCWFVSRTRYRSRRQWQDAPSPRSLDLTSPRAISIELSPLRR